MHEPRDIFEAHITAEELLVVEHPHAAVPLDPVAVESKIHFLYPPALGARSKSRLGPRRTAAEQDAL
jgi:hypothetical protein